MNPIYFAFLAAAFAWIQYFIGGTRLVFSLPAYAMIGVVGVLSLASIRSNSSRPDRWCAFTAFLFAVYLFVRGMMTRELFLARSDLFEIAGVILVYWTVCFCVTRNFWRIGFVWLLLVIALLNVWVGIIQFSRGNDFMLQGLLRAANGSRASGLFISPNHFAGYLESVAILGLSFVAWGRMGLTWKMVIGYAVACCYFGVAISGSRGGYFSCMASVLIFGISSLRICSVAARKRFAVIALSGAFGLALVVSGAAIQMRHSDFLQHRFHSMLAKDVRWLNWEAACDQFRLAPVFGTGAGTHLVYGRLFRRPGIQTDPIHAHGDYLELLAEYGIAGGILFFLMLGMHLRNGINSVKLLVEKVVVPSVFKQSDSLALTLGALCAIGGMMVHSVFDFNMHIPGNALLYAFLFGVLASPGLDRLTGKPEANEVAGWFRFMMPVVGATLTLAALLWWPTQYFAEMARSSLRDGDSAGAIQYAKIALGQPDEDEDSSLAWMVERCGPDRSNPELYFIMAEANRVLGMRFSADFLRSGYLEDAVEAYHKALSLFPEDENSLIRLGQSLDQLHRYQEAEVAFKRVLQMDPNLGVLYAYYGAHLKAMGNEKESKAAYEKGQSLSSENVWGIGRPELGL